MDVSVIIVTHNREKLLPFAVESVLKQKFSDFELIIIDDASGDNTEELVKKYLRDSRVRYFKIPKAKSIAQVRNSAWPYVQGKYIAVLDSDDIWIDDLKLAKQFEYLENHPEVVLIGSGAILINENGEEIGKAVKPISDAEIKKDFFIKNPIYHSSVMYRYAELKQIGAYDEKMTYCDDMDLWLRFGEIGKLYNFPDTLIKYRIHKDNESVKNFKGAIIDVLKFIARNRKKYRLGFSVFFKKIFGKGSEYLKK
jgi:glycosyltransferase involved in cell wall biosynthesis